MIQQGIRLGFFFLLIGVTLWFLISAGCALISYSRHSLPIFLNVKGWEVQETKTDVFQVIANFSFEYKGEKVEGKGAVEGTYPNHWAAEKGIEKRKNILKIKGWIHPKNSRHILLVRTFPWKKTIYAGCVLTLLGYFSFLLLVIKKQTE